MHRARRLRFEYSAEHCLVAKQPDHAEQSARSSEVSLSTASSITTAPRYLERSEMAETRHILDPSETKKI